jgi:hypothetical protein
LMGDRAHELQANEGHPIGDAAAEPTRAQLQKSTQAPESATREALSSGPVSVPLTSLQAAEAFQGGEVAMSIMETRHDIKEWVRTAVLSCMRKSTALTEAALKITIEVHAFGQNVDFSVNPPEVIGGQLNEADRLCLLHTMGKRQEFQSRFSTGSEDLTGSESMSLAFRGPHLPAACAGRP